MNSPMKPASSISPLSTHERNGRQRRPSGLTINRLRGISVWGPGYQERRVTLANEIRPKLPTLFTRQFCVALSIVRGGRLKVWTRRQGLVVKDDVEERRRSTMRRVESVWASFHSEIRRVQSTILVEWSQGWVQKKITTKTSKRHMLNNPSIDNGVGIDKMLRLWVKM